jgi:hypothetical protein
MNTLRVLHLNPNGVDAKLFVGQHPRATRLASQQTHGQRQPNINNQTRKTLHPEIDSYRWYSLPSKAIESRSTSGSEKVGKTLRAPAMHVLYSVCMLDSFNFFFNCTRTVSETVGLFDLYPASREYRSLVRL